jgi:hypothetical protein
MQSVNANSVARSIVGLELIIDHLKAGHIIKKLPARGRKAKQFKPLVFQQTKFAR